MSRLSMYISRTHVKEPVILQSPAHRVGETKLRSGNGAFRRMCQNLAPMWRGRKGKGESKARIGSRSE